MAWQNMATRYPVTQCFGVDSDDTYFTLHQPLGNNCVLSKGNALQGEF
jgi:hypothetical protein